ncbi:hypothetical protein PWT90_02067 [Aphanocladium album]|nr:hypothetical protein PWT90_02067 [Aphanocladium album]
MVTRSMNTQDHIAIAEIVVYPFYLVGGIYLCVKHGISRTAGFRFLVILALARLIGSSLLLVTLHDAANERLRSFGWINRDGYTLLPLRVLRLVQVMMVVAMILVIVGGTQSDYTTKGTSILVHSNAVSKAGMSLMIVVTVALVSGLGLAVLLKHRIRAGETRPLPAVAVALPFVIVRLAYDCVVILGNKQTSIWVYLPSSSSLSIDPCLFDSMAALSHQSLKVVVVGAGPAGLCAAAALRQDGHAVTVLERQRGLQAGGNALVIQPAAVKALTHLRGAHAALEQVSVRSDRLCYWSYKGDEPFAATSLLDRRFETDRPSVQRALYDLAVKDGVEVRFGSNIEQVEDRGSKATLRTSDGEVLESDLIVAADGIKSKTRQCLFPNRNTDPIPLRESIFITTLPTSQMAANPDLVGWLAPGTTHGTLGPGRFVLSRPLHGGRYGVQFIDVDHADPGPVDGTWNTPADVSRLRALFADFNPITRACLAQIERAEKWQIAVGPKLDAWRSEHGRVVLLGDAAHAMIPHAAQGLSQGIEDGISLARMLRGVGGGEKSVGAVTEAWERMRKPRAELFVQRSMNNATLRSLPDGPAQEARDAQIAKSAGLTPKEVKDVVMDMKADQNTPEFMKWVREYDVVAEADKLIKNM